MLELTTDTKYNFSKAESDLFSWSDIERDFLTYKLTGQKVYQMEWYVWKNSTPITDKAIIKAVTEFWTALEKAQNKGSKHVGPYIAPETHGTGWCNKCGSYCYGDCTAN